MDTEQQQKKTPNRFIILKTKPFLISIDRIHFKILRIVTNGSHTVGIPFFLVLSIKEKQEYLSFIYINDKNK